MENASKALLMAGGVLIALLIIALLIRSFTTVKEFQLSQLSEQEQAELIAFNEQYTKYLKQYVYGTEVKTLMNKYENDRSVFAFVDIDGEEPDYSDNHHEYDEETKSYSNNVKYYKCTEIKYNDLTGRVDYIKFKQIIMAAEAE